MPGRLLGVLFSGWMVLGWPGIGFAAKPTNGDTVLISPPISLVDDGKIVVGGRYADVVFQGLTGDDIPLSELVGPKVVLLQFWGIRCGPCYEEMKFLSRLQDEYGSRGLQVLGVNADRATPEAVAAALSSRSLAPSFPVVLDADSYATKRYTKWLVPVTALIDRSGVVVALHTGYRAELNAVIVAEVEQALGRSHAP